MEQRLAPTLQKDHLKKAKCRSKGFFVYVPRQHAVGPATPQGSARAVEAAALARRRQSDLEGKHARRRLRQPTNPVCDLPEPGSVFHWLHAAGRFR